MRTDPQRERGTTPAARNARLLTLDTRTDSTADALYPRWGWHAVGKIRDYALDPDGKPAARTLYWKRLA